LAKESLAGRLHASSQARYVEEVEALSAFTPAPVKPTVSMSAVEALDVRVGTIVAVEGVPRSAKLLKLTVDLGDHARTILAGMKTERANPQEIVGRQALFVVNLEPRRMAGELSQGLLFDIGFADGIRPVLAVPETAVPNGARAG
jgi:methionine--tRNA ligase beta chain